MGNDYDKVFKENLEMLLVNLASQLLDIDLSKVEELPDDLQRTIERKPDFLKKVLMDDPEEDYILQIEFQSNNHPEMHYRMYEYHGLLLRRYQLEIRQYVIYVGMPVLKMESKLEYANLSYQYEIIDLSKIPYQQFLDSTTPEEITLSILGDFGDSSIEKVVEDIFKTLKSRRLETLEEQKFVTQIEVLSKLRNLQEEIIKLIPTYMPINYNLKEDERYKQGKAEERLENIKKLIAAGVLTIEQIAKVFEEPIDRIKEIAASIK